MKKLSKILALSLSLLMLLALVACSQKQVAEIAMITDIGSIDDKSFNQGTWEGVKAYADANKKGAIYYQPKEQSNTEYLTQIEMAVKAGAKVIVTPGYLFEEPIFQAQDMYPDTTFILLDGNPNNGDWSAGAPTYKTGSNTVGITYAEQEAGYLAGYAAVKGGYTKLGFMGGMAVPAVVRYGYGFIQGAEDAAKELGIASIDMKYHYTGGFAPTPEAKANAASWYNSGTEVIFACGGGMGNSVMEAAREAGKFVIGVDVDQSPESDTVITSAMKGLAASVEQVLGMYYGGKFPGGENLVFNASNNGVKLPMESNKIEGFTQADYDALFAKLAAGSIAIPTDADAEIASDLPTTVTTITVVN